jgi:hypothetical protein
VITAFALLFFARVYMQIDTAVEYAILAVLILLLVTAKFPRIEEGKRDNENLDPGTSIDRPATPPVVRQVEFPWNENPRYDVGAPRYDIGAPRYDLGAAKSVDDRVADRARRIPNTERVLTGAVEKNKNYYARAFADELDQQELLQWWGNNEY